MLEKVLNILLNEQMITGDKWYKVLEAGTMYSKKYSGFLCGDPAKCNLQETPGKLTIDPSYLAAVNEAFEAGAHETQPYVDVNHDRDQSCGNIRATRLDSDGTVLMLAIDWNEKGVNLVGNEKNGIYRYLSVAISDHLHSKTGKTWPFVLKAASLTNDPVFKDQEILALSERSTDKSPGEAENYRRSNMDKIKEIFAKLLGDVKAAMQGEDEATIKEAIKGAAMDFLTQIGIPMEGPDMADAKKKAMQASEKAAKTDKVNMELAEKVSEQAKSILELTERVNASEEKAARLEFSEKWGNRFAPADFDEAFSFYLKDQAFAEKQFAKMPVISLGEKGHGGDTKLQKDAAGATASIQLAEKSKAISKDKGISISEAYLIAKAENPDLVKLIG